MIDNDPYVFVTKIFLNKWKPFIIRGIDADDVTRFSKFTRQLPISDKVLATNLRELEDDGIVDRIIYPEIPPRVEYKLTKLGKTIMPILDALYHWGWNEMKRRNIPIDSLGEMWHGYASKDKKFMKNPFKSK